MSENNLFQARMKYKVFFAQPNFSQALRRLSESWKHSRMWRPESGNIDGKCLGKSHLSFTIALYCLLTKWTQKRQRHKNLLIYSIQNSFYVPLQCVCFDKDMHYKCFQNMIIPLAGENKKRVIEKLPGEDSLYLYNSPSRLWATWDGECPAHRCHSASTSGPGMR